MLGNIIFVFKPCLGNGKEFLDTVNGVSRFYLNVFQYLSGYCMIFYLFISSKSIVICYNPAYGRPLDLAMCADINQASPVVSPW